MSLPFLSVSHVSRGTGCLLSEESKAIRGFRCYGTWTAVLFRGLCWAYCPHWLFRERECMVPVGGDPARDTPRETPLVVPVHCSTGTLFIVHIKDLSLSKARQRDHMYEHEEGRDYEHLILWLTLIMTPEICFLDFLKNRLEEGRWREDTTILRCQGAT